MKCIDEAFREQAALTPDAAALRFGRETLTYQNLSQRAGALAHRLRARGVGPDVLVGLFVERSADMVVAMLGVLMAGGAYVPLDPTYPAKRIAYVLADAKPLVILTHRRLQSALPRHQARVIIIDDDAPDSHNDMPAKSAAAARSANDLAYVIYTSGSTGEPKGVEIPHRAVTNMLASMQRKPGLTSADTMLAITTLAFDIAVLEIFLPLVCGACVVVAPSETTADGEALASLIGQARISIMQATPATLRMLLEAGWNGAPSLKILCGGEAWPADLASQLLPRCASLWNMYGPTETTVWSAVSQVEPGAQIVIGAPIANTRFYVLNGARELVPVGVPGELYIGGAGLARGYFNRPELTAERFTKDPFVDRPQARIYRTGDLVRRLADGTLEFMGRVDHQVKIRGHRVELGEIEAALQHHESIGQCVVVAQDDPDGGHRLVAYYISTAGARIAGSELRSLLGESLPAYMVPSAFVPVDAFPLTPNGKLDRKALPPPETAHHAADDEMIAPRTPTEIVLAKIWCDTLHLDRVGIRDNFFDLGGHSLLAVRVIGQINGQLKLGLTVPAFFQNPTIEGLARSVTGESQASAEPQVVTIRSGNTGLPLYFIGARPSEYVLGRMIGGGRTVHAIDVPLPLERLDPGAGSTDRLLTIEEIAALYSDLLFTHAGKTPCVIVGYSLGGKIAFEVARLLQRAGGRVAFILIVDAWAFTWTGATRGPGSKSLAWLWRDSWREMADDTPFIRKVGAVTGNALRLSQWLLARIPVVVANRLHAIRNPRHRETRPSGYLDRNGVSIDQSVIEKYSSAAGKLWHPSPLEAAGVLFRAHTKGEEMLPGFDFSNGWSRLFTRGFEIVQSSGTHVSMVDDENIGGLARRIEAVLERHEALLNREKTGSGIAVRPDTAKMQRTHVSDLAS